MNMDVVEFYKARLAERDARARALPPGPWRWIEEDAQTLMGADGHFVLASGDVSDYRSWIYRAPGFDDYVREIEPERILREIAAGRRLVERYERAVAVGGRSMVALINGQDDGYIQGCLDAIKDAAEVHDTHPYYEESWRP